MHKVHLRPSPPAKGLRGTRFGVIDIETWGLEPKSFALGVSCIWGNDGQIQFTRYRKPDDMREDIFSRKYRGYTWWGHNVEYDLLGIIDNPLTFFKPIIYSNSQFILGVKQVSTKNTIRVCDSHNLFKTSVSEMGKCLGYPKSETPKKFIEAKRCAVTEDDFRYCERDTEIVLRMLHNFRNWIYERFKCNIGITIASTALKVFTTNWGIDCYVDDWVNVAFRKAYYGGRTEVFRKGTWKGPLYYYDVNSLYPYIYSTIRYPNPSRMRRGTGNSYFRNIIGDDRKEGCAHVRLTNELDIPILPVRIDGKLYFPKGEIQGWYCFPELRYALTNGYRLVNAFETIWSHGIDSIFSEYAKAMYEVKKTAKANNDPTAYIYSKYLMNSLYGKFGECREDRIWGRWDEPIPAMVFSEVRDGWGYWGPLVKSDYYTDHTIFPFCAYVTSASRVHLYKQFKKCNELYYTDTDSLITDSILPVSDELGDLKLEETIDECTLLHPKCYEIKASGHEYRKVKGIPWSDLPKDIRTAKIEVHRYTKSKESIRRGIEAGRAMTMTKRNNWEQEDKRVFDRQGLSRPFLSTLSNDTMSIG